MDYAIFIMLLPLLAYILYEDCKDARQNRNKPSRKH